MDRPASGLPRLDAIPCVHCPGLSTHASFACAPQYGKLAGASTIDLLSAHLHVAISPSVTHPPTLCTASSDHCGRYAHTGLAIPCDVHTYGVLVPAGPTTPCAAKPPALRHPRHRHRRDHGPGHWTLDWPVIPASAPEVHLHRAAAAVSTAPRSTTALHPRVDKRSWGPRRQRPRPKSTGQFCCSRERPSRKERTRADSFGVSAYFWLLFAVVLVVFTDRSANRRQKTAESRDNLDGVRRP